MQMFVPCCIGKLGLIESPTENRFHVGSSQAMGIGFHDDRYKPFRPGEAISRLE